MQLINNDCIAAMKEMSDNSVDSIVTDPPYELGFMGKSWDSSGIAFNLDVWREALRVLKPGGHLIAFSGSRTYHRMAVAIEDAGFEIRDQIMWVYGSGFPKSLNIAKALDKSEGLLEHEGTGMIPDGSPTMSMYPAIKPSEYVSPEPRGFHAKQWDGWGTALKPAHEPMVLARKPLIGTVANNVLTYGVGGLNIDASRVGSEGMGGYEVKFSLGRRTSDGGEHSDFIATTSTGRFPANFIHDGSDEVVALFPDTKPSKQSNRGIGFNNSEIYGDGNPEFDTLRGFADSGSAARFFYCAKASKRDRNEGLEGFENKRPAYESHRPNYENTKGIETPYAGTGRGGKDFKNFHPTVKPTNLMRYLVRLVTPPNGIVLDPFMGSGSTGKACAYEGFDFIGIEQSAEYIEIAQARIDFALNNTLPLELEQEKELG